MLHINYYTYLKNLDGVIVTEFSPWVIRKILIESSIQIAANRPIGKHSMQISRVFKATGLLPGTIEYTTIDHFLLNFKVRNNALIFSTVLYGCEVWTMTKNMEKKHVRCGYRGRCKEYHGWRKRIMKVYDWRME